MADFNRQTLLVPCLLFSAFTTQARGQSSSDFAQIPQEYKKNSPAGGGPTAHPNAAVVIFYRKTGEIAWNTSRGVFTCKIRMPVEKDDNKKGGPTPVGEYLIGRKYEHPGNGIDWYNLYPRKEDNSGYYPYREETQKGRNNMGLHPGQTSLGCVTVNAADYDENACWKRLASYVDAGTLTYRGDTYSGFLYVVDK